MSRLKEVAAVFLKLGFLGFGGPAVHIAMMEEEVVRKRNWMTHDHFIDLIGATNLIPGPNSTEMALHCGKERAGWKGLLVAGACFILPAVIITAVFAWLYRQYGTSPRVEPYIYGIKPAIIGVIPSLMITLGEKAVKSIELAVLGIAALVLAVMGVNEVIVLFGIGIAGMAIYVSRSRPDTLVSLLPIFLTGTFVAGEKGPNLKIFWIFLKIGAILYGSGYVLFSFLNAELVKPGLLSRQALTDAIAVGQFTPGPVFSSATFIGWQMGGLNGAALATAGIFLPSFLFVGLLNPLVYRLRKSKPLSAFLDAVNDAAIALILTVCFDLGRSAINNWQSIVIAAVGFVISSYFKKLNTAFVIIGGALVGYLFTLF